MIMTSTKPYFIRAINEWILDNELTPYILIDAEQPGVFVPKEFIKEGKIVFNITPGIVSALIITNDVLEFDARFSGRLKHIYVPINAVLGIYAKENGRGMMFELEVIDEGSEEADSSSSTPRKPPRRGKPQLKVIK